MYNLKWIKKGAMLLAAFTLIIALSGCGSTEKDYAYYESLIKVVYDGNGAVLGNKTATVRTLRVEKNSKIPRYVDDALVADRYHVSGLGFATRSGYQLVGWYLEENATYAPDPLGRYVFLDTNYQNGVYKIDSHGDYVYRYTEDEAGSYVFVFAQVPEEGQSTKGMEYIYFEGSDGYGFYIYDADNAKHAEVYKASGGFTPQQVGEFANLYVLFNNLDIKYQNLFADLKTYQGDYHPYTTADGTATRYTFGNGYAELSALLVEDSQGMYVQIGQDYVLYDQTNSTHNQLVRLSVNRQFKFTSTGTYETPSDLPKYGASIVYWDFANNRVTESITLKAHWVKKLTVEYIERTGRVIPITTKLNEEKTANINLEAGKTIGKIETIPQYYDSETKTPYTFVNWSKSETEYIPWDFANDVFPNDSDILKLYAFMVEGNYTRITSKLDLAMVGANPKGSYLLVNDIDLGGAAYHNSSPLGFQVPQNTHDAVKEFTGKFVSMGHEISNFVIEVSNSQKQIFADSGVTVVTGLFPVTRNATIQGLIVKDMVVKVSTTRSGTNVILNLGSGGLIGTALAGTTVVKDCYVDVTFIAVGTNVLTCDVYVGDIVSRGNNFVTITNSTADIDYSALIGITTGSLIEQILN